MKKITLLAFSFLSATVLAEPPAKIDVSRLPKESRVVDDVIVPVPSEIFGVLDKLGKPNWAGVLRPLKGVAKPFGEPPQQGGLRSHAHPAGHRSGVTIAEAMPGALKLPPIAAPMRNTLKRSAPSVFLRGR